MTDEPTLSETRLAGGQKQYRTFPDSILLLASPLVVTPLFRGLPLRQTCHQAQRMESVLEMRCGSGTACGGVEDFCPPLHGAVRAAVAQPP